MQNKVNKEDVTIGSDPELFIVNENDVGIPSEEYFNGSKDKPTDLGGGFQILCDNVMVEYNIPAVKSADEFVAAHKKMFDYIAANTPDYISVDVSASKMFIKDKLQSEKAKEFGCEPDFSAWLRDENQPPNPEEGLRSCGGHIHVGYPKPDMEQSEFYIRLMDYFLGVPSVLIDKDIKRRTMYGKAGCCRFKEYGFEYRTLSNFWLKDEKITRWAYNQIFKMFDFANANPEFDFADKDDIQECINTSNVELAKKLMAKYGVEVPAAVQIAVEV
jgi:hypothetical protein